MRFPRIALTLVLASTLSYAGSNQHPAAATPAHPSAPATTPAETPEQRTEKAFDAARQSPPALYAFLRAMPKGGDLHNRTLVAFVHGTRRGRISRPAGFD